MFGLTSLPAQLAGILVFGVASAYWLGYGVTRWLLPHAWLPYRWLLMPAVGLAFFAVVAQPLGLLGVSSERLIGILGLTALVVNGLAVWKAPPSADQLSLREWLAPFGVALGTVVFGLLPLFTYGYITVMGYNVDGSTYVAHAEFSKQFGLLSAGIYTIPSPYAVTVARTIESGIGVVAQYWLSAVSVLTGRDAFYAFTPLLVLWHALSFLSVYVLYRVGFHLGFWTAALALAALALNSVRLMIPLDNFAPHTFALALLPLEWLATQDYFEQGTRRGLLFAAVTVGGQILVYPEATPFYVLPIFLYGVLHTRQHWARAGKLLWQWVKLGLVTVLICPTAVWTLYASFVPQVGTVAQAIGGTLDVFITVPQAFGLNAVRVLEHPWLEPWDTQVRAGWDVIALIASIVVGGLIVWGLVRAWQTGRHLLAGAGIAMVLLLAVMLFVQNYPYGWFKTLATGLFVLVALAALGAQQFIERLNANGAQRRFVPIAVGVIGLLFVLMGVSMVWFQTTLAQRAPVVTRRLIQLANSTDILEPGSSVYLSLTRQPNPRMYWTAYFLRDHPLHGSGRVAYSELHNAEDGVLYDYALLNREENPTEYDYAADSAVWDDRWTVLYKK